MIFIKGRKKTKVSLGFVADFCPICRKKSPFILYRLGSAFHIYYIGFGQGKLVGYEKLCTECQITFSAEGNFYASISKTKEDLRTLIKLTLPNFDSIYENAWR